MKKKTKRKPLTLTPVEMKLFFKLLKPLLYLKQKQQLSETLKFLEPLSWDGKTKFIKEYNKACDGLLKVER